MSVRVHELTQTTREQFERAWLAAEAEAAELAKTGDYRAAAAKYEDGEDAREAYDRLTDHGSMNRARAQFPSLFTLPPSRDEFGIAPTFTLPTHVEPRGYDPGPLSVVDLRTALTLIATNANSGLYQTYNHQTHTLLADASDLGTGIAAIPRWIVHVLQHPNFGVVSEWKRVVGHKGRVYADVFHRAACLMLADADLLTRGEADVVTAFEQLRAVFDERVAKEKGRREARNKRARDRRASKRATVDASAP